MGLKFEWQTVHLEQLVLEMDDDGSVSPSLRFDYKGYTLRNIDVLTPEAISILMQLHPIYVIHHRKKLLVVAGKRIFHAAAFCLRPEQEVTIAVLNKNTTKNQLLLLKYIDLAVSSLLFRQNLSVADIYRDLNIADIRQQVWLQPLANTMQGFAEAMGVSAAALCAKSKRYTSLSDNCSPVIEAPPTGDPP